MLPKACRTYWNPFNDWPSVTPPSYQPFPLLSSSSSLSRMSAFLRLWLNLSESHSLFLICLESLGPPICAPPIPFLLPLTTAPCSPRLSVLLYTHGILQSLLGVCLHHLGDLVSPIFSFWLSPIPAVSLCLSSSVHFFRAHSLFIHLYHLWIWGNVLWSPSLAI